MQYEMQITEDDAPFVYQEELVGKQLQAVREALQKKSISTVCLDCGEDIDPARVKAMPSATRCIDCERDNDRYNGK
jgi:RNA polymerase-binding transcription factor DksA